MPAVGNIGTSFEALYSSPTLPCKAISRCWSVAFFWPPLHCTYLFQLWRQEIDEEGEQQQPGLGIHTNNFLSCYNWPDRAGDFFKIAPMCVLVCGCAYLSAVSTASRKGRQAPELELQVVVSHLTWVLETELRSSGRPASPLNH